MIPSPLMKGESWHTARGLSQSVVFQKVGGSRHNLRWCLVCKSVKKLILTDKQKSQKVNDKSIKRKQTD